MCQLHQQDEASRAWAPNGHAVEAVAQPPVMDSLLRFLLLLLFYCYIILLFYYNAVRRMSPARTN